MINNHKMFVIDCSSIVGINPSIDIDCYRLSSIFDRIFRPCLTLYDKLFETYLPTVTISFWVVLEIYRAVFGAVFRCPCRVWSPQSKRNVRSVWRFPWRFLLLGSSSWRPLKAMLLRPQKITVLNNDPLVRRFLAIVDTKDCLDVDRLGKFIASLF